MCVNDTQSNSSFRTLLSLPTRQPWPAGKQPAQTVLSLWCYFYSFALTPSNLARIVTTPAFIIHPRKRGVVQGRDRPSNAGSGVTLPWIHCVVNSTTDCCNTWIPLHAFSSNTPIPKHMQARSFFQYVHYWHLADHKLGQTSEVVREYQYSFQ